jgi:3-isopropylmalate/(R)-2-methylmalate dehydratase small subunit
MEAFKTLKAIVAPLDRANVDTDAIIPKQFLKSIKRTGFGAYLFDEWRFLDPGTLDKKPADRLPNPEFVLNQEPYNKAQILLAQANFGCGSSREHAPWALADFGFKVVIAPSFADIFFNNCFKNGILPIQLPQEQVNKLFALCQAERGAQVEVDLDACEIRLKNGEVISFTVDPGRRDNLLNGRDDIDLILQYRDQIQAFEDKRRQEKPWLFNALNL